MRNSTVLSLHNINLVPKIIRGYLVFVLEYPEDIS